jgi:hypothetical protein
MVKRELQGGHSLFHELPPVKSLLGKLKMGGVYSSKGKDCISKAAYIIAAERHW